MPIREVRNYVNEETEQQVIALVNIEDENDIKVPQGTGTIEMEVPGGGKMKKPIQFPFPEGVTSLEEAFAMHTQAMTAYITQVEEQYKEATRVVGPDGKPAGAPKGPIQFPRR